MIREIKTFVFTCDYCGFKKTVHAFGCDLLPKWEYITTYDDKSYRTWKHLACPKCAKAKQL